MLKLAVYNQRINCFVRKNVFSVSKHNISKIRHFLCSELHPDELAIRKSYKSENRRQCRCISRYLGAINELGSLNLLHSITPAN
jgi:hypothetical protein